MKLALDTDQHNGVRSSQSGHAGVPQVSSDRATGLSHSHSMESEDERDALVRLVADQTARIAELEAALSRASDNAVPLQVANEPRPTLLDGPIAKDRNRTIDELVVVTQLLRKHEDDAEWLRKVAATLLGDSRLGVLISLLPGPLASLFRKAQLKRRDLFDASIYRAANPDVASARIDALRHYIIHGMGEGRARR